MLHFGNSMFKASIPRTNFRFKRKQLKEKSEVFIECWKTKEILKLLKHFDEKNLDSFQIKIERNFRINVIQKRK